MATTDLGVLRQQPYSDSALQPRGDRAREPQAEAVVRTAREQALEQQSRPEISAESFTPRMRIGLLLITMLGEMLLLTLVVAAAWLPHGLLDISEFWAVYVGGLWLAVGFFLMIIYGALVGGNPRLNDGARLTWLLSFAVIGLITLPAYWVMHVWPAPFEPWTEVS